MLPPKASTTKRSTTCKVTAVRGLDDVRRTYHSRKVGEVRLKWRVGGRGWGGEGGGGEDVGPEPGPVTL